MFPHGGRLAFRAAVRDNASVNLTVTELTDRLIASYARVGGINHLDGKNLPSKTAIATISCDLLRLLFPGFFDERSIHSSQLKMEIATLMDSVLGRLEEEVYKSLEYAPPEKLNKIEISRLAHSLTLDFLSNLPQVRDLLQTDIEAAYNGDPSALSKDEVIVAYPFVETVAVQRLAHELYKKHVPLIPRIMTEWAHGRTGIDLHPGAKIGSHFFIDHGTGTVFGETVEIGNHVKMYQGVVKLLKDASPSDPKIDDKMLKILGTHGPPKDCKDPRLANPILNQVAQEFGPQLASLQGKWGRDALNGFIDPLNAGHGQPLPYEPPGS